MAKVDDLYEQAQVAYMARSKDRMRVLGFRDDMQTIRDWYSYNMQFKPIKYGEYLKLCVDQMNGDVPHFQPIWRYDMPGV